MEGNLGQECFFERLLHSDGRCVQLCVNSRRCFNKMNEHGFIWELYRRLKAFRAKAVIWGYIRKLQLVSCFLLYYFEDFVLVMPIFLFVGGNVKVTTSLCDYICVLKFKRFMFFRQTWDLLQWCVLLCMLLQKTCHNNFIKKWKKCFIPKFTNYIFNNPEVSSNNVKLLLPQEQETAKELSS